MIPAPDQWADGDEYWCERLIQFTGLKSEKTGQNDVIIYRSQRNTLAAESAW